MAPKLQSSTAGSFKLLDFSSVYVSGDKIHLR